jgi:extracellular factor (EF) 3-hydroxypalmitic acid methyl ester biosynthesis protein
MERRGANTLSTEPEGLLVCETSQGLELRASLVHLSRHKVVFEVYHTQFALRTSEVLNNFRIMLSETPVYSGRAVVKGLINTGTIMVVEAELSEGWMDFDVVSLTEGINELPARYKEFLHRWYQFHKVLPEFKLWVAEVQTFLMDLRLWCDQIELGIRSSPAANRLDLELDVAARLAGGITESLNTFFERFEILAEKIEDASEPAHHAYIKRHLHPLVLCSPFAYRTFHKPLGYAGDYEMVNMLLRDAREGASLFAKLLNCWFIAQPPARAHRNRIEYLTGKLTEETLRVSAKGRSAQIFNLGCGPAAEVQRFIGESAVADRAKFMMLDFNEETLRFANTVLSESKQRHQRKTEIQLVKKSVMQILKTGSRAVPGAQDFIYCAGLFDYLPDRICKELLSILYDMLAPGGVLLATNVDCSNPIRNMLDYLLEWHLIYRTGAQMRTFAPEAAEANSVSVQADPTSVNVFLEVRKPAA